MGETAQSQGVFAGGQNFRGEVCLIEHGGGFTEFMIGTAQDDDEVAGFGFIVDENDKIIAFGIALPALGPSLQKSQGKLTIPTIINLLKSIKNPVQFYNYIQQSETLQDIFLYYKDEANAQTYGGFKNNQNAFNKAIEDLGLREFTNIDIE